MVHCGFYCLRLPQNCLKLSKTARFFSISCWCQGVIIFMGEPCGGRIRFLGIAAHRSTATVGLLLGCALSRRISWMDCTVLSCTVLYCTVLYCTVLYCTVLYCTVLYCTVLYLYLYCTVLYSTVLYCTQLVNVRPLLCCTVPYCNVGAVLLLFVLCFFFVCCSEIVTSGQVAFPKSSRCAQTGNNLLP